MILKRPKAPSSCSVRQAANPSFHPFDVVSYEVNTKLVAEDETVTTANVVLRVNGNVHSATATGQGPVNALDVRLRQCLSARYPAISDVRLVDYKVRVLGAQRRYRIEGSGTG